MVTDAELKKGYSLFSDTWRFYKRFMDVQLLDEYWEAVVMESDQLAKRYGNSKLVVALIFAVVDELERKSKDMKQSVT